MHYDNTRVTWGSRIPIPIVGQAYILGTRRENVA
jgi:hypothetical protein